MVPIQKHVKSLHQRHCGGRGTLTQTQVSVWSLSHAVLNKQKSDGFKKPPASLKRTKLLQGCFYQHIHNVWLPSWHNGLRALDDWLLISMPLEGQLHKETPPTRCFHLRHKASCDQLYNMHMTVWVVTLSDHLVNIWHLWSSYLVVSLHNKHIHGLFIQCQNYNSTQTHNYFHGLFIQCQN